VHPRPAPGSGTSESAGARSAPGTLDQLRDAYHRTHLVLFVGAGLSQALGAPAWRELIDHLSRELGVDRDDASDQATYLTLAEYFRLQRGGITPLRVWMERHWQADGFSVEHSRAHELIVNGRFPLIYTTNYDRWLEAAFEHHGKPYAKVVRVADLPGIRQGVTQIVKFHGDFDDEASIVLDESSYFRRLDFEAPLDIKLRADALGRSVLFIGYSLSDINIRYLFYRLSRLWKAEEPASTQPRSFFFSTLRNPVQQAVLAQWGIDTIIVERPEPTQALVEFLESVAG
jgi:hypothetical protein